MTRKKINYRPRENNPEEDSPAIKVHPFAALFPMLNEQELQDLADDIKANGLLNKISRDKDGQILEGRNRLKACQIAGVQPQFKPTKATIRLPSFGA